MSIVGLEIYKNYTKIQPSSQIIDHPEKDFEYMLLNDDKNTDTLDSESNELNIRDIQILK